MIMPVKQHCPKCGKEFMGSDCIGAPCLDCSTDIVGLSKGQIAALKDLGPETGHFRVNWRYEDFGLSHVAYVELLEHKLIEEHWTWASVTRPDVGITQAGLDFIKGLEGL